MSFFVLNPTTISPGNNLNLAPTSQMANCVMIGVLNDSPYGLNVVLPSGSTDWIAPQQGKFLASTEFYGQNILIQPMTVMSGNFAGLPQFLTILGYSRGEQTPPAGTTIDMSKVVIVANTVATTGGNALSVVNDNNISGTPIIEATASGSTGSNVQVDNAGNITVGVMQAGNLLRVLQTVANPGAGVADVLLGTGNNFVLVRGQLQLSAGAKLTNWSVFSGTASTVSSPFNHGLGLVPDLVLIQRTGTANTVETFGYDPLTMTNTQVNIVSNGAFNFIAFAIKF